MPRPAQGGGSARTGGERGLVIVSVLAVVLVLSILTALLLYLSGKETALSRVRAQGAESFYVTEGGAYAARAALMAYMNANPIGVTSVDPGLTGTMMNTWYAGGTPSAQNPLAMLDYLWLDNQRFVFNAAPSTPSVAWQVQWSLPYAHLKLATVSNPAPSNSLGAGSYSATVTLTPNPTADPSCAGGQCAMHLLGTNWYEIFYAYQVTSTGQVPPHARREILFSGTFSVQLRLQTFAAYALFTDTHTTPSGGQIWFTSNTSFNGPVHTNTEFAFAFFPTFTDKLTSVSTKAWYNNNGSPVELTNNENVSRGVRIDAPLVPPDPNPQAATPANFTRGVPNVPLPTSAFSQQGVAVGRNPTDTSAVTTAQITAVIPELTGSSSVPNGIYVPVTDAFHNCLSTSGDPMAGGIYVQGNLDSLTMSVSGSSNNLAVYTLGQGSVTTTVTVDRTRNQTTVTSNGWLPSPTTPGCPPSATGPNTRTFTGVPQGWQQGSTTNDTMIYVNGGITAFSGTLQQNEQTTVAASGTITIAGNVLYQTPPNPSDPTSNPTNVLGLFSSGGDIVIGTTAPNNVTIDAVLMAGTSGSTYHSSVNVQNYSSGSPRGNVNLLGGMIEKYYGPFGTFNPSTGQMQTGYGRAITYDPRMSRGFSPPFFPTTNEFELTRGSQPLAGVRPTWREGAPP